MNRNDLKVYKYNQKWIEGRLEYIKEYKERILSISISLSGIKIEKKIQDSMAENLAILLDNINELLDKINAEEQKQKEILN